MNSLQTVSSGDLGPVITRDDLTKAFDMWLSMQGKSEHTRRTYLLRLGKYLDWLGSRPWSEVVPVDVVRWRDELASNYAPQSVALHLTAARRFYSFLVEKNVLLSNPFSDVAAPTRKNGVRRKRDTLTRREWQDLLATCDTSPQGLRDAAIFWLAYELGLREVEITRLDVAELRSNAGLRILWVQSKGDVEPGDWLVIPEHVEAAINDWLAVRGDKPGPLFTSLSNRSHGGRLSLSAIRMMWNDRKRRAGIVGDRKTFHSLRHTAIDSRARYAVKHGKSPFLVQTFARHKSLDTTMQYIHDIGRLDDPPELWGTNLNGNGE